jgi:pSer/pThr/pTyr-binding forkhead associated (FHA) protein
MFRSDGQRKDFPLSQPVSVIGRGENCDLRVPLLNVSRRHCEVRVQGQTVKVKDLASSNGTYVNNTRISDVDLHAGDRLAVGPIVFTIQVSGSPADIRPVASKGQRMAQAGAVSEDVVDLDAEVISQPGASAMREDTVEVDPIAALEALADEDESGSPPKKPT